MTFRVDSMDAQGTPCRHISLVIIAHGADLRDDLTPTYLQNKIHKLMLGGFSGNVTQGSKVLDALFFNATRMIAHNRTMHHVDKLNYVRNEVLRYPHIGYEIGIQQRGQEKFVTREMAKGSYQRVVDAIPGWLPPPSTASYNRRYSFNANDWDAAAAEDDEDDDDAGVHAHDAGKGKPKPKRMKHKHAPESREFGIWVADASIDIANEIGFTPGIHPKVISLMPMLRTVPTTARRSPTPWTPDMSASDTTLFELVHLIQQRFGENTYVNVVDLACRFYDWDRNKPEARLAHAALKSSHRKVDTWLTPFVPTSVSLGLHNFLDSWSDEVLSPAVDSSSVPRIIDYVSSVQVPLSEVVYWERNGAMKYQPYQSSGSLPLPLQCTHASCESDVKYLINRVPYGLGDTITVGGRDVTIFYILEGGTCFFVHDANGKTLYVTPIMANSEVTLNVMDNLTGIFENKDSEHFRDASRIDAFASRANERVRPSEILPPPPPFLPPYHYSSSHDISTRLSLHPPISRRQFQFNPGQGGRSSRNRVTKNKNKKKHKRRSINRKKTKQANK